ncbi:MAG TPA: N-glycosylase/DNA lyase [Candidatus Nanoarchaeia archaeon]|nr:N-glycosylase/DNA lyase [Candidatus Nanoarchaeia archaeon]
MELIDKINRLKKSPIRETVDKRLLEFKSFENKTTEEWFSELCFCLLTANSRASSAMKIQDQITGRGFMYSPQENIAQIIRMNKHRFHNNKAKFIVDARKFVNIKAIIHKITGEKGEKEAREFLVENVKGLGYKESSHFLRNVGYTSLAILDRHILNLMVENNYINERPKTLTKNKYLEIEEKFNKISDDLDMTNAELDLYMWYMKTGVVLK